MILQAMNPEDPSGAPLNVVLLEDAPYWDLTCKQCGFVNGGHWLVPGGGPPIDDNKKCIQCGSTTEWLINYE